LRELPSVAAAQQEEEHAADEALARAVVALRDAEAEFARLAEKGSESARLAAARAAQHARDAVDDATLRLERAREERGRLERAGVEQRGEAEGLERRAAELATELGHAYDGPPTGPGVDCALEWAARARGALLVAHAGLATEREEVVREASELVASVLGEPLASTSVADLRSRLAHALGSSPP
jgi:hypothetical protein